MFDLTASIEAARRAGIDVWVGCAASMDDVSILEGALGVALPASYRRFLTTVGALSLHANHVAGIIDNEPLSMLGGSAYSETLYCRQKHGLPTGLLVIQPDDDAPYCLDLRHNSADGAVVCFELHSNFVGKVAATFEEWLVKFVFYGVEGIGPANEA